MLTTVKKVAADSPNVQMKESFADVIYNLSPTDTPFTSMCKRESISAIEIGWFADKLSDATVPAGIAEGADAPVGNYEEVKRVMNLTQIFMKSVKVSNTAESVDFYGRKSEMAYQMTKKSQELKRDIEATLCGKARKPRGGYFSSLVATTPGGVTTNSGGPDDTIREMSNFKYQVINNPLNAGGPARTVVDAGFVAVSEKLINDLMEKVWLVGGNAKTALVTSGMANSIAKMALTGNSTGGAARYRDIGQEKKLVNVVDVYVTPFGEMKIGLSRWLNYGDGPTGGPPATATGADDIILIDPKYISLAYLRQPNTTSIPQIGDREEKLLTTELTFKLTAPDGCGLLTNVKL